MFTRRHKTGMGIGACGCCCCAVIFGSIALYFWYHSFLTIKHECEIYYITTELCRYACGQTCYSTNSDSDSDDSYEITHFDQFINFTNNNNNNKELSQHCTTRYCWGYEYVYYWRTMDWKYPPYKVNGPHTNTKNTKNALTSALVNKNNTNITHNKLKILLNYINNNDLSLSDNDIKHINLNKYMKLNDEHQINNLIKSESEKRLTTGKPLTTYYSTHNPFNVNWCDYLNPAYISYGTCSSFPYQWYSRGEIETCWTNSKCNAFSTLSPYTNWDLAKAFGFTSITCLIILFIILIIWLISNCYQKIHGYYEYDYVPTHTYTDDVIIAGNDNYTYTGENDNSVNDTYTIQ